MASDKSKLLPLLEKLDEQITVEQQIVRNQDILIIQHRQIIELLVSIRSLLDER